MVQSLYLYICLICILFVISSITYIYAYFIALSSSRGYKNHNTLKYIDLCIFKGSNDFRTCFFMLKMNQARRIMLAVIVFLLAHTFSCLNIESQTRHEESISTFESPAHTAEERWVREKKKLSRLSERLLWPMVARAAALKTHSEKNRD